MTIPRASDHHGAGCQPTGSAKPIPPPRVQPDERINSMRDAELLPDAKFLAFCMIMGMKHFISLVSKRWPELR